MQVYIGILIIFSFGAIGGVVNALLTDNGFILPLTEESGGAKLLRPGFLINVFIGGIAAVVSWGLYGPASDLLIYGATSPNELLSLNLASAVGAIMIGIGGAKWLTDQVDKSLLRAAASEAAAGEVDSNNAIAISTASPANALRLASRSNQVDSE